ncbi:MAG: hypothetical protein EXR07_03775 [Acetobacteraceae bacterium]|nr:hypothetical protein [Acetobacteraceae bacterium]
MLHRIYFDANEGDEQDRFDLGIPGSLADIAPLAGKLTHGMRVLCYDNQEIEVEAILEWDAKYKQWMATPQWDTIRRLDEEEAARLGAT